MEIPKRESELLIELKKQDFAKTMCCLGGLLLRPELQANCHRIETMMNMTAVMAVGQKKPSKGFIGAWFSELSDEMVGAMDDPSESLFISQIACPSGNFKIANGLWEGSQFYLKLFMEILEEMPSGREYAQLRECAYSLLALSDEVIERAGLVRNLLGDLDPKDSIPDKVLADIRKYMNYLVFTDADLKKLKIQKSSLAPFVFDRTVVSMPGDLQPGTSVLERYPLLRIGNDISLAMPTAVGNAIKNLIISKCLNGGLEEPLTRALTRVYSLILKDMHIFGGPHDFVKTNGVWHSSIARRFDKGRWVHVIAIVDGFKDFFNGRFGGSSVDEDVVTRIVDQSIQEVVKQVSVTEEFRGGMSLLVGCGWGRGMMLPASLPVAENWLIDGISVDDLEVLSRIPGYGFVELWKTLDMRDRVEKAGVTILNLSGLLNLIGWEKRQAGHQIPHSELPFGFASEGTSALIQIPNTELRDLRKEAADNSDALMIESPSGSLLKVYRTGKSYFDVGNEIVSYASIDAVKAGTLLGVCIPRARPWWLEVKANGGKEEIFQFWEMMLFWMRRISSLVESLPNGLLLKPVSWILEVEGLKRAWSVEELERLEDPLELYRILKITIDKSCNRIHIFMPMNFQSAFNHPENFAERMLVHAFLDASLALGGIEKTPNDILQMVQGIMIGPDSRHIHMLQEKRFRDRMIEKIPKKFIKIGKQDNGWISFGLVGMSEEADKEGFVRGEEKCKALLNALVTKLEIQLADMLKLFDRKCLIKALISNYEAATCDKDRWRNTSKAIMSLNEGSDGAMDVILDREAKRNVVLMTTRIVVEAANCECPEGGITEPGEIDISRMMATASAIYSYGGWSDAIHCGLMDASIKISPFGDILTKHTFEDEVVGPYGKLGALRQVEESISEYEGKYVPPIAGEVGKAPVDAQFSKAWECEFGLSLDSFGVISGLLEEYAINIDEFQFLIKECELIDYLRKHEVDEEIAKPFLASMKLMPRSSWWEVPSGYLKRDRESWRFRRRLSLMRHPIIQLDLGEDPTLLIAPDLIHDAVGYLLWGFLYGTFPGKQYPFSKEMRSWLGLVGDRRGTKFNGIVATRLKELGWETISDQPVSHLLKMDFGGKNYGDIDVLAWNKTDGRVLVIECKDLIFSKTYGEICQQMNEFLGEVDSKGRPDLLLKHLERMEIIKLNPDPIRRFTGLPCLPIIESHLVFHNPVPMGFSWDEGETKTKLWLYDDLERI